MSNYTHPSFTRPENDCSASFRYLSNWLSFHVPEIPPRPTTDVQERLVLVGVHYGFLKWGDRLAAPCTLAAREGGYNRVTLRWFVL